MTNSADNRLLNVRVEEIENAIISSIKKAEPLIRADQMRKDADWLEGKGDWYDLQCDDCGIAYANRACERAAKQLREKAND